jgi:hypothetical protein
VGGMPPTSDADLPTISDDTMRQGLAVIKPYTVLILKKGPNFASAEASASSAAMPTKSGAFTSRTRG